MDSLTAYGGYGVTVEEDDLLEVMGLPTAPVLYNIHAGNNLISYPYHYSQNINDALDNTPANENIEVIYGEGFTSNPDFTEYSITKIHGTFDFNSETN